MRFGSCSRSRWSASRPLSVFIDLSPPQPWVGQSDPRHRSPCDCYLLLCSCSSCRQSRWRHETHHCTRHPTTTRVMWRTSVPTPLIKLFVNTDFRAQSYNVLSDIIPPRKSQDVVKAICSNLDAAKCPPCFNCMLPVFTCGQYAECNQYDGQCKCPPGWAGIDCLTPRMDPVKNVDVN